jgi:7,8-dihydropterin-6-yl-methyl-4-(beta-D-ribofuranosyl)aminobenzene 5'-phosphate synthase
MKLRATTLSENTAGMNENAPGLVTFLAEWGLSILVETDEGNILLDTGQSISAAYNADILGIDLSRIDRIVLSHGHFDHTGGLRQVLRKMNKEVEIIAHPDIWTVKYSRRQGKDRYIGMPFLRQELEGLGASFNLTTKPVKITDNIMTTGEIPMVTDFEAIDPDLVVKEDSGFKPDKLLDDQALIINAEPGLIVILGCAHRGIINTLYYARQLTGVKQVYAVLGGCHLISASQERIRSTIAALKELDVQKIGVSHCTGLPAAAMMAQELDDRFFFNTAGTSIDLP